MKDFSVVPRPAQPGAGQESDGRSPRRGGWGWFAVITVSGLAAGLLVVADSGSLLRQVLVVWFLAVCPGMAYVRLLGLRHAAAEWALAVALSFAMTSLVAMVMIYAGWWSPNLGFMVLLGLAAIGVVLWLGRWGLEARRRER